MIRTVSLWFFLLLPTCQMTTCRLPPPPRAVSTATATMTKIASAVHGKVVTAFVESTADGASPTWIQWKQP